MWETLSRGTYSRLPLDVNVMLNLSNVTIDLSINGYSHSKKQNKQTKNSLKREQKID